MNKAQDLIEYLDNGGDFPPILADYAVELKKQHDLMLAALRKIGMYTGEGSMYSTPWQDIVADLGQTARDAIRAVEEGK